MFPLPVCFIKIRQNRHPLRFFINKIFYLLSSLEKILTFWSKTEEALFLKLIFLCPDKEYEYLLFTVMLGNIFFVVEIIDVTQTIV